jgi:hypothetical protein
MSGLPPGMFWSDDLNIELPPGRTIDEIVELVLSDWRRRVPTDETVQALVEIGLDEEDGVLAWDRVHGGVVRAATRIPENCPSRSKDPFAWTSFQRATSDPSIVADLCPEDAAARPEPQPAPAPEPPSRRRWWRFWE